MRIDEKTRDWIRANQATLKRLIEDRTQDYLNRVVDEEDSKKKEVLSLFVKELRMIQRLIENIVNKKEDKKPDAEFTGL